MEGPQHPSGPSLSSGLADIPLFTSGEGPTPLDWLNQVKCIASLHQWDDRTRLLVAHAKLRPPASMWLEAAQPATWQAFQTLFLERFGEDPETAYVRFEECAQRRGETARNYRDRFVLLATRADRAHDPFLTHRFLRGLSRPVRQRLLPYSPMLRTLDDIVQSATALEKWSGPDLAADSERAGATVVPES